MVVGLVGMVGLAGVAGLAGVIRLAEVAGVEVGGSGHMAGLSETAGAEALLLTSVAGGGGG